MKLLPCAFRNAPNTRASYIARKTTRFVVNAVFALACLAPFHRVSGQTCKPGELRVFIKDSQESPIFDAQVRLTSGATEFGTLMTSTSGIADFKNVPCGSWSVQANKGGFDEGTKPIEMTGAPNSEISLTLNPEMKRSSVEVKETVAAVDQSAAEHNELHPTEVKNLPTNPATVAETLPLVPGVVRSPQGELIIDGTGEQRSAFVVNQSDVTNPATGQFGQTIPVDAIETVNVLTVPFLAQYGRFTQTVVAVETRRGGDKWHADLNDPFPGFPDSKLPYARDSQ